MINTENRRLLSLYARYVSEPESRKDVYGYWLFVIGCTVSFIGVAIYQVGPTDPAAENVLLVREISATLAGIGLPVGLLGIVLMLPVKRIAMFTGILGALVSLAGVAAFTEVYPSYWVVTEPDYSSTVITVYTAGVAIVTLVAALVPVITGEQSFYFGLDRTRSQEYPDVMVGKENHGASVAVYRGEEDWTWRLIEQDALATDVDSYTSRLETEERVEHVQERIAQAGLMEINHAAFRLTESVDGWWSWILMRENGSVVANSNDGFPTRDEAAESVSILKEFGPDAPIVTIEGAAYDCYEDKGDWYWRLIDEDRNVLASGPNAYGDRPSAVENVDSVRVRAGDAEVLTVERFGVELFDESGDWQWRLLDTELDVVATGSSDYDSRRSAESSAYDILEGVAGAPIVDSSEPAYEVSPTDDDMWRWELVDEDGTALARSKDDVESAADASDSAQNVKTAAPNAPLVHLESGAFEYYRVDGRWRWRLVSGDREPIAESTGSFASRDEAAKAVETTKEQALAAELIDFENSAFQLYETNGEWRWRLIDEDGNVMADSGEEHGTRDAAAESMLTLKENAPDADLLEIETSAFELFHDDQDRWNWRLVNEGGETIGEGPSMKSSRDEAKAAMDELLEHCKGTESREMPVPVFEVFTEGDGWRWRLVNPDGSVAAEGTREFATRNEAETAIESRIRDAAGTSPVHEVDSLAVRLVPSAGNEWRWELIDAEGGVVAESARTAERATAEATIQALGEHATDAPVFEFHSPSYVLTEESDGWHWTLVDVDRKTLADGEEVAETKEAAQSAVETARRHLPNADVLDDEDAVFEITQSEGSWSWRFLNADEEIIAGGTEQYDTRTEVEDAIDTLTDETADASILEIDSAAFELHKDDDGWRWRLIDENGRTLVQSLATYSSHQDAREATGLVKEFGSDAVVQVAE
ncbi:DUF1508 domain-containing protein [Haloarchaeobius sp. HRN-SO-5]|uniref:DUF1508 domain-containing protein n=1 Tax=Haloarchaeobius sp. HRN-SO-5 TaxID=3446118 RepID=UPI003EBEFCDD